MATKKTEVILHGEAMLFPAELPADCVEIKHAQTPGMPPHIIADSETTGNHHVVDMPVGTKVYKSKDDRIFIVNTTETRVRCVHPDRHSPITMEPGCWEVGIQQEYDHLEQHMRQVRD
ncbi:MAG: hypothetical protein VKK42_01160 [Lyngbya sp.]|nr:hypothetical protein [Lyngbya sp.]